MADEWYQGDQTPEQDEDVSSVREYDIISSPNDFNIKTIFDFIESDVVVIPRFQRHFVWDLTRASRLIESIVMGLPIPQIFLYEKSKDQWLIIDGQQRLLSIYYFMKQRFPKLRKRAELRKQLLTTTATPDSLFSDNNFFQGFKLSLPVDPGFPQSPLDGLDYDTLGDQRRVFDLRTIRIVIVKQASPKGDESIYEIFNRLNTGGMNLHPQEIRMSLHHSEFIDMLAKVNFRERWRALLGKDDADAHLRDVEFLLRGLALLFDGNTYSPSMAKFLNGFARKCAREWSNGQVEYAEALLNAFFASCENVGPQAFYGQQTSKFTVSVFDAVFVGACAGAYERQDAEVSPLEVDRLDRLRNDAVFVEATLSRTTGTGHVKDRLRLAKQYLGS